MISERRIQAFFALGLLLSFCVSSAANAEIDYYRYLQRFGYTPRVEGRRLFSVLAKSSYTEGILKLQRLYKLPETGQFDDATTRFMQKPRCGNPDLGTYESIGHPINIDAPDASSTYVQGRSGGKPTPAESAVQTRAWPKTHLKWFIEKYPEKQKHITSNEQIRRIISESLADWEKHSGLTFEMAMTSSAADLKIKFSSGDHGDGYPFDGQGSTLAHAFYPTSGDVHFDDDDYFTDSYTNEYDQYTLRLVAAHEIGHALGLEHSYENDSLMYPVYQQFNRSYQLSFEDQQNIQALYGKPRTRTTVSPVPTAKSPTDAIPIDNWCSGEFQTGCEGPDGELYLFRDDQVWRYQAKKRRSWDPQPTLISERFPSLSDAMITTCVKSSLGYTYLFRNYRMWKIKTHWSVDGPHMLYGKNYPQHPRVALLHQNSVYLVRHHLIYRLNELDPNRELEIRTIDSILIPPPDEYIRSGFTYAKRHYIFTRHYVFVYDATSGHLLPGYPKSKRNGWFACEAASQAPRWRDRHASTTRTSLAEPFRNYHHEDDEDPANFHHHHHHHHRHRPRRPWSHHHRRPSPPYEYRRRWED